jgi:hypothetical protein
MADTSLQVNNNPIIDIRRIPDDILDILDKKKKLDSFSELQKIYIGDRLKYYHEYNDNLEDFQLIPSNDLFDTILNIEIDFNSEKWGRPDRKNYNYKDTDPNNQDYNILELPTETLYAILNHEKAISSLNLEQRGLILHLLNLTNEYQLYNRDIKEQIKMFKPTNFVLKIITDIEKRIKAEKDVSAGGNKPKSRKVTPRYKRTTSKKYHKRHIY